MIEGQVLCLQSFSALTTIAPATTMASTSASLTPTVVSSSSPNTLLPFGCQPYTVVVGDTCWAIANRFMITVTQLQMNNPTVNCAFLQVGSNICVQGAPKTTSFAPAYTSAAPAGCTRAYTVVSGDSCLRIATIFGTTFDHLRTCNPTINTACSNLAVGQIITY